MDVIRGKDMRERGVGNGEMVTDIRDIIRWRARTILDDLNGVG